MYPQDCPKFDTCSAPICPLDADWKKRTYLDGEPVCPWMLQAVKAGAEGTFQANGQTAIYTHVVKLSPSIAAEHPFIGQRLERSAIQGSKKAPTTPKKQPTLTGKQAHPHGGSGCSSYPTPYPSQPPRFVPAPTGQLVRFNT